MSLAEKKQTDQRTKGLSDYAKKKRETTIQEVSRVIDDLQARDEMINFEIVARRSGVSRGTLYNNEELCERIKRLRAGGTDEMRDVLKEQTRMQEKKICSMRKQIRQLEDEKKKLIIQLIDHEELRRENERLRKMLGSGFTI